MVKNSKSPFVLFILQPTNLCNLNCSYCYLSEAGRKNSHKMEINVQREVGIKIANSKFSKNAHICWHVGEPLLAGIDFYRQFIDMMNQLGSNADTLRYSIQTNGTLINEEWIKLVKEYDIHLSLSLDGPDFIHDRHRVNWAGKGSHLRVQRGIDLMRKEGLPLKGLCVLTDYSFDYPDEIFYFFLNNGFSELSFNPEEQEAFNESSSFMKENGTINKAALQRYKKFMSRIFDLWFMNRTKIVIREFETVMKHLISIRKHGNKINNSLVQPLNVISIDMFGNISTFSPELIGGVKDNKSAFIFGNIFEIKDFDDLLENVTLKKVYTEIQEGVAACQEKCGYFDICGGGAPSNKLSECGSLKATETTFCLTHVQIIADIIQEKLEEGGEQSASQNAIYTECVL